ncbi:unnamed protein product, partial [Ilex paraguariensis]
ALRAFSSWNRCLWWENCYVSDFLCLDCSLRRMHGSSGCLGSDMKPKLISSIDEPLRGQKLQVQTVSKPSISDDLWTTSTYDMDNSAVHSHGSISSISTSNQTLDAPGTSSANIPSEFINHGNNDLAVGLLLWNQTRQQWLGSKKSNNRTQLREPKLR